MFSLHITEVLVHKSIYYPRAVMF